MNPRRVCLAVLASALVGIAAPHPSHAQSAVDATVRRELVDSATRADAQGQHAQALDLARRAGQISMTPSLRMFIAQQESLLGLSADGYASAMACAHDAESDPSIRNRDAILATCRRLVDTLRARVGRVTVTPPNPAPAALHITLGGRVLSPAMYGLPYIVMPGEVVIEATASGERPFHSVIHIVPGEQSEVNVVFGTGREAGRSGPSVPSHHVRPVAGPVTLAAIGAAGLVSGIVFAALRADALHTLDGLCTAADTTGTRQCFDVPAAHAAADAQARWSIAADVGFGLGAAALIAGAVWYLVGGHEERNVNVSASMDSHGGSAIVGVRF